MNINNAVTFIVDTKNTTVSSLNDDVQLITVDDIHITEEMTEIPLIISINDGYGNFIDVQQNFSINVTESQDFLPGVFITNPNVSSSADYEIKLIIKEDLPQLNYPDDYKFDFFFIRSETRSNVVGDPQFGLTNSYGKSSEIH